ncbi:hypothetical protein QBC38DRAFT_489466 [Podospora fimiseda]|uniref:Uncharacterized protein n=1 Tax=Podospora fimiseda TaxID=252190 RepID=A0AAN7BG85_9PEZI|nr:hypothetical protein QBC38DRAFT_489466 [Podospora fimiseda]
MPGAPGGMMHPGMQQLPGFPNSPNPQQQAQQAAFGSPNPNALGASPILQHTMSPSALWTAQFANGPIIEDLCAPPPHHHHMTLASPPMNALPPRGPPGMMHMPQVQNVYGVRQPGFMMSAQQPGRLAVPDGGFPPPAQGLMQLQQQHQMQMQWHLQQQQAQAHAHAQAHAQAQHQQRQQMEMELARLGGQGGGQQQQQQGMDSPQVVNGSVGTPNQGIVTPLTPVESAMNAFLASEI